jgi:hypothetical protein
VTFNTFLVLHHFSITNILMVSIAFGIELLFTNEYVVSLLMNVLLLDATPCANSVLVITDELSLWQLIHQCQKVAPGSINSLLSEYQRHSPLPPSENSDQSMEITDPSKD